MKLSLSNLFSSKQRASKYMNQETVKPKSQAHEVVLTLLEYYPNRVPIWELFHRCQSTRVSSVISFVRKKLKQVQIQEIQGVDSTNPIINEMEEGVSKYGNRTNHSFYKLNARFYTAATILEKKLRNEEITNEEF
jgi:hypothetical protein